MSRQRQRRLKMAMSHRCCRPLCLHLGAAAAPPHAALGAGSAMLAVVGDNGLGLPRQRQRRPRDRQPSGQPQPRERPLVPPVLSLPLVVVALLIRCRAGPNRDNSRTRRYLSRLILLISLRAGRMSVQGPLPRRGERAPGSHRQRPAR